MSVWWNGLNVRERILVIAVALVVVFVVVDAMLIEPYRLKKAQLSEQTEQAAQDLEWMKEAVHRIPQGTQANKKIIPGRMVTFVDQQITRHGLKKQMLQMTPIQNHSVRLRLSDVSFDKLLTFFAALEGFVLIEEVRILPADRPGFVNASLVVSNGDTGS